jgi:4-hydroxybenzoate polyprenyltransferase
MVLPAGPSPLPVPAALLRAAHLAPTLLVTSLTTALAVVLGRGPGAALLVAAATLTGQLSIGWSNDAVDAARDRAAGRDDKPVVQGRVRPADLATASTVALALCLPLSWLASGLLGGAVHLVAVGAGWVYNLWLKPTVLSWLPYAVAFGVLPAFVWLGLPGTPWPPAAVMAASALLGTAAHLANALPDRQSDLDAGTGGLVTRLSPRTARVATAALVLAAVAVASTLAPPAARVPALLLAVGLTVPATRPVRGPGDRRPLLALGAAAALGVVLVGLGIPGA